MIKTIERTIVWGGDVTPELAVKFTSEFLMLQESTDNIRILCTGSDGGDWDSAGLGLMDLISNSPNYITTVCLGSSCSTAAMMFCCGDCRIIGPNSYLMFHDGTLGGERTIGEHEQLVDVTKEMCRHTHTFLSKIEGVNKPPSFFKEKMAKDWYVFAEEAANLGLATEIYSY